MGGLPHLKDEQTAGFVGAMSAYGVPEKQICNALGIKDVKTLHKYYEKELKEGRAKADAKLLETAYKMAVDEKNTSMTIFLLKTRLGMKETSAVEMTSPDGTMATMPSVITLVGKKEPEEEIDGNPDSSEAD